MENKHLITRHDFMTFFRDDDKLCELSTDDRIEVFRTILTGSSDITKELLNDLLADYCVGHLQVVEFFSFIFTFGRQCGLLRQCPAVVSVPTVNQKVKNENK
jgi:hypothetical protein